MDLSAQLERLARIETAPTPVVSVYLNTHWTDEHQRDRVRVFLKHRIREARLAHAAPGLDPALDWVQAQGEALVAQGRSTDAHGVALFASQGLDLWEVLPVRVPFEDMLVVGSAPFLGPLAALLEGAPSTLVVFVDSESARLVPLTVAGASEEVVLESEVPGHHRQGGWALLAQSRYQRHIQDHRDRHFEAVAHALVRLVEEHGIERVVLAGEPRTIAIFRKHLPARAAERLVGAVSGSRWEPASALIERATPLVARLEGDQARQAVDAALTEAAKGGQAVAGVGETLEAVSRGAVHRLLLLRGFRERGAVCAACRALQVESRVACRLCGGSTAEEDLGEAMVARVIATGGTVTTVPDHVGLGRVGGVAALLRYPL